jgi:hypothetical protein
LHAAQNGQIGERCERHRYAPPLAPIGGYLRTQLLFQLDLSRLPDRAAVA